jgi:hypothetical protein
VRHHGLIFIALLALEPECNLPDKICETDEEDNHCATVDDCVVAYCASDCSKCAAVYSHAQVDEAWCLTPLGEEPYDRCKEAGLATCSYVSLPVTCPRYITAACEGGKCIPKFEPP